MSQGAEGAAETTIVSKGLNGGKIKKIGRKGVGRGCYTPVWIRLISISKLTLWLLWLNVKTGNSGQVQCIIQQRINLFKYICVALSVLHGVCLSGTKTPYFYE